MLNWVTVKELKLSYHNSQTRLLLHIPIVAAYITAPQAVYALALQGPSNANASLLADTILPAAKIACSLLEDVVCRPVFGKPCPVKEQLRDDEVEVARNLSSDLA